MKIHHESLGLDVEVCLWASTSSLDWYVAEFKFYEVALVGPDVQTL